MSRESLGYVKLEWICPNCGGKNPGPEKTCLSCGKPQPENVAFQQAERQELIQDEKEIEKAKAGADIHCGYCGARNPAGSETCLQCGADMKAGKQRESGKVVGAFKIEPEKQIACPHCGVFNPDNALNCGQCGASLARPPEAAPVSPQAQAKQGRTHLFPVLLILFIGICVLGAIALIVVSTRTTENMGKVSGVSWERSVAIEALREVQREAFLEDIPDQAKIGSCALKYHHTQPEPAENSEKVCGTPYTVDRGSGYAEVVQDCEYRVMKDYCDYTVQEWVVIDEVTKKGTDFTPVWPEPSLDANERIGRQAESYACIFSTEQGAYTYHTSSLEEMQRCKIGSEWLLNINAFDAVVSIKPK